MDEQNRKASPGRRLSPLFTWRGAVADSELRSTAKLVAFALSLFMSEAGDSCFPSLDTLAHKTSTSRSTVTTAITTLVDEGWLVRKRGGGRGRSTHYTATVPETVRENDTSETVRENAKPVGSQSETVREPSATTPTTTSKDHDRPRAGARKRYPMFDELARECGLNLDAMTKEAARLCAVAAREIEAAGGTVDMVRPAVRKYRSIYVGAAATPKAIANHWPEIVPATSSDRAVCEECGVGGGYHLDDCLRRTGRSDDSVRLQN